MAFEASVHAKAIDLTRMSLEMTARAGSGHPTSAASLAHIVTVLMYDHMRYDPADVWNRASDVLVLSEGHACPIVYAACADLGVAIGKGRERLRRMTRADALRLRKIDSEVDGHPNPAEGFPFFPAATGSLGQGLSVAAGIALAARLDGLGRRAFCLIGDGESREGQIWEAIDMIADFQLTAVCPIFSCNGYGQCDAVSVQQSPETLARKLEAAGLEVREIDGHSPSEVRGALARHAELHASTDGHPMAVVARTLKGWGFERCIVDGMHGEPLVEEQLEEARVELERTAAILEAAWSPEDLRIAKSTEVVRTIADAPPAPSFREALSRTGSESWLDDGAEVATRRAFGVALQVLGHASERIVALDGDVRDSTYSTLFHDDPPLRERFFDCRIGEQNMVSCAVGLAAGMKIPFVSTFGKFLIRACDQIEMALIGRANLKLVGSHCGVSLAADGPSQMGLSDMGFFRAFTKVSDDRGGPLLYVLQPADAVAAYALTAAMAEHEGACYLRVHRPDVPLIYPPDTEFSLGGHHVLERGSDVLLVASGYMVHAAREAIRHLAEHEISATLVDLYSLPCDARALSELARGCGGKVVTVEDNYAGGIGSAVAEALLEHDGELRLEPIHVRQVPKSGRTPTAVLEHLGLDVGDVVQRCKDVLRRETPS